MVELSSAVLGDVVTLWADFSDAVVWLIPLLNEQTDDKAAFKDNDIAQDNEIKADSIVIAGSGRDMLLPIFLAVNSVLL